MREETIKIYKFEELSKEAQEVAIEKWRNSMDWGIESQQITENFEYRLQELNYPTQDISWSLSYCQGDGVAFYGTIGIDNMIHITERLLEGGDKELFDKIVKEGYTINARIYRNSYGHRYSHWNTMVVEVDGDDIDIIVEGMFDVEYGDEEYGEYYDKVESLFTTIESVISDDIQKVSKELEKDGYSEIEYYESDECIIELLTINDYEFTEDGIMY